MCSEQDIVSSFESSVQNVKGYKFVISDKWDKSDKSQLLQIVWDEGSSEDTNVAQYTQQTLPPAHVTLQDEQ